MPLNAEQYRKEHELIDVLKRLDATYGFDLQPRDVKEPISLIKLLQFDPTLYAVYNVYLNQPTATIEVFFAMAIKALFLEKKQLTEQLMRTMDVTPIRGLFFNSDNRKG